MVRCSIDTTLLGFSFAIFTKIKTILSSTTASSLEKLVTLGLKAFLFKALEYSANKPAVLPLHMQKLFTRAELEEACLFQVTPPPTTLHLNGEAYNVTHKPALKSLLPPPKDAKPSHGTTSELFQGESGLI